MLPAAQASISKVDTNRAIASHYQLTYILSLLLFHQGHLIYCIDQVCDRNEALPLPETGLSQTVLSLMSAGQPNFTSLSANKQFLLYIPNSLWDLHSIG